MKVLITGATGLIGSELSNQLLEKGATVHYLTTRRSAIEIRDNYKGFYWNPKNDHIDRDALNGVEVIVHLAGATIAKKWTQKYRQVILESRTGTAKLILKAVRNSGTRVRHFISASGISYYPPSATAVYDESYPKADNSFLGRVVEAWEASALAFKELGIKVAIVRTGLVLSDKDGALPRIAEPVKWGVGAALGNGKQWQSWIHIDDLVGIYTHLIQEQAEGLFNAVAPYPVTNRELTKALARELNRPMFLPNIPSFVIQAVFGEMSTLLLKGQKVLPARLVSENFSFKFPDLEAALSDIYSKH